MTDRRTDETPSIFTFGFSLFFLGLVLFFGLVRREQGFVAVAGSVLVVMYAARLWARFSLAGLGVALSLDRDRLFPGEELALSLRLENRKILPVWTRLDFPLQGVFPPSDSPEEDSSGLRGETRLLSFERTERTWKLGVRKRGVFPLGPARVSAGDLLGLHRKSRTFPFSRELIVFPRRVPLGAVEIPFQEYFGIHASKGPVEDPAWYAGTRDYTGNRPAKNIHWKAGARLGTLQEKLFEPTSHRKVLFVLDIIGFLGAEDPEGFERALEALGSLAAGLMETGASFGFVTNARLAGGRSRILPLGRGPEHLGIFLELLARAEWGGGTEDLAAQVREIGAGGMGFVYCGYAPDERTRIFFHLPSARRKRVFFLFLRRGSSASPGDYPAYVLEEPVDAGGS